MPLAVSPVASPELSATRLPPVPRTARRVVAWSRRRVAVIASLVTGDLLAAGLALGLTAQLTPAMSWDAGDAGWAALACVVPLHALFGLYGCWGPCPIDRLRLRAQAALMLAVMTALALAVWQAPDKLLVPALLGGALFVIGYYMEGLVRLLLVRAGLWGAPTLLVGSPEICGTMAKRLLRDPKLGLRPIGLISSRPDGDGAENAPVPILGGLADLARLSGLAEVVIVAVADLAPVDGRAAISLSDVRAPHVVVSENVGGLPNIGLHTRNLGGALGLEVRFDLFRPGHLAIKRWIDLAVTVPLLVLATPLILVLAFAVKIADPGHAFYRQRRVGRDGRELKVLKLRTMYADADTRLQEHLARDPAAQAEWERFFKLKDDPRILPVIGHFLRRSSLDELPQLWNIVCGGMSLVGPRPFPEYHMASFDPGFQSVRVSVPPGLTGLWQVSSRSGGDLEVQQEEDLFYIRNWSLWLDIYILLETFPAVLTSRGAR
ncbi:exopolysaccharide biosynthesis polyprenyl glycosylphosphotransferase [Bosea sp. WAO]|uniref:exopolysaccharide biosynthesis polyprenyl glycosylphosphotransferase n=1 Tax=Bosea sp. WAO TaxID=406341 RepID=UPI00082DC920|nr:exopolysaccharide biosynthesis polyprenyl glycosylphosphotransferase [Bosea sp. WAO]